MKRFLSLALATLAVVLGIALTPLAAPAQAIDVFKGACDSGSSSTGGAGSSAGAGGVSNAGSSSSTLCGAAKQDDVQDIVKTVINTILVVLGMIAVIMIVIGGIRYTTSNGDSSAVTGAKNTILYAVVGLIIAILSYAIVNFVLGRFS